MSWIAGVDGCKRGWVAAFRDLETERLQCGVFDTFAGLLDSDQRPTVVAVDMPIGLLEAGDRACDLEARSLVPGRGSIVFPAPIRPVLALDRYEEANALTRQVNGKGLSRQSFALVPKIREVDEELRARKADHVWEAFPELAFVNMNDGKPRGIPSTTASAYWSAAISCQGFTGRNWSGWSWRHLGSKVWPWTTCTMPWLSWKQPAAWSAVRHAVCPIRRRSTGSAFPCRSPSSGLTPCMMYATQSLAPAVIR